MEQTCRDVKEDGTRPFNCRSRTFRSSRRGTGIVTRLCERRYRSKAKLEAFTQEHFVEFIGCIDIPFIERALNGMGARTLSVARGVLAKPSLAAQNRHSQVCIETSLEGTFVETAVNSAPILIQERLDVLMREQVRAIPKRGGRRNKKCQVLRHFAQNGTFPINERPRAARRRQRSRARAR